MARSSLQSHQRYPLTAVFGTEANVRVLRELSRGGSQMSAPALIQMTRLSKFSVAHSLARLEALGIVQSFGSFRTRLYRLRTEHPFHSAIDQLFDAEADRFEAIMASIKEAAVEAEPSIIAVWLYGSVARDEDHADSDLDLAVIARDKNVILAVRHLRTDLSRPGSILGFEPSIVGMSDADILRLGQQDDPWWTMIMEEARPVFGPTPAQLLERLVRSAKPSTAA